MIRDYYFFKSNKLIHKETLLYLSLCTHPNKNTFEWVYRKGTKGHDNIKGYWLDTEGWCVDVKKVPEETLKMMQLELLLEGN